MLIVAGAGPGSINHLTMESYNEIKSADIVLAFGRIAGSFDEIRKDIVPVQKVDDIIPMLDNNYKKVVILASGDPNFFGIAELLRKKGITINKIIPGISSMQYLMAKIGESWQDYEFYSFHGRPLETSKIKSKKFFILTDDSNNPDVISEKLFEEGFRGEIFVGKNLSYGDEEIFSGRIGDKTGKKVIVSVVAVKIDEDTER